MESVVCRKDKGYAGIAVNITISIKTSGAVKST